MDNHADNFIINGNYLAGLIDSDFGVYIHKFYPRGHLQLRPTINFTNTNFDLVELCSNYLKDNSIHHHVGFFKATVGRDIKTINIKRQHMCLKFIDDVINYTIVRKPQLEVLSSFCSDRLKYVNFNGWTQNNTPYTDYQIELYQTLYNLNLNYNHDYGHRNYTPSWLGGLIDGDGSVCFVVSSRNTVLPTIDITTESDTCLNNIKELYTKIGIKYDVRTTKSKATKRIGRNAYKYIYNIYVRDYDSLLLLLKYINGKLFIKQRQVECMYSYIILRNNCSTKHYSYEQLDIVAKVKTLNKYK